MEKKLEKNDVILAGYESAGRWYINKPKIRTKNHPKTIAILKAIVRSLIDSSYCGYSDNNGTIHFYHRNNYYKQKTMTFNDLYLEIDNVIKIWNKRYILTIIKDKETMKQYRKKYHDGDDTRWYKIPFYIIDKLFSEENSIFYNTVEKPKWLKDTIYVNIGYYDIYKHPLLKKYQKFFEEYGWSYLTHYNIGTFERSTIFFFVNRGNKTIIQVGSDIVTFRIFRYPNFWEGNENNEENAKKHIKYFIHEHYMINELDGVPILQRKYKIDVLYELVNVYELNSLCLYGNKNYYYNIAKEQFINHIKGKTIDNIKKSFIHNLINNYIFCRYYKAVKILLFPNIEDIYNINLPQYSIQIAPDDSKIKITIYMVLEDGTEKPIKEFRTTLPYCGSDMDKRYKEIKDNIRDAFKELSEKGGV